MDEARMAPIFDDNFITSSDMIEDVDTTSPIKDYLRDKTIFLTGGFGFLGKLLIEKLLRCDVKKIYLLVRAKKGKSLDERFEKLIEEPVSLSLQTLLVLIKLQCNLSDLREAPQARRESFRKVEYGER